MLMHTRPPGHYSADAIIRINCETGDAEVLKATPPVPVPRGNVEYRTMLRDLQTMRGSLCAPMTTRACHLSNKTVFSRQSLREVVDARCGLAVVF